MFRNRNFMLGLGIGLIVGAFLLQLMNIGQGQQNKPVTVEQIQQAAEKLRLKVVSEDERLLTEEEWKAEMEKKAAEEPVQPKQPDTPDKPAVPQEPHSDGEGASSSSATSKSEAAVPAAPELPDAKAPATAESASVNQPEPVTVKYKIAYGDSLTAVADGLQKAGVISSSEAFIKEASKRGINTKIRTGTYSFQIGEKYSSIITKITTKPSAK
ncbi:hypothetical protein QNH46_10970 [Paenibacillus woosongensis]|uniref:Uncharacterized protein n=1 Tax=Paenibacillus woosongensis TaxID=307580 RepID=A0AA95IAV6_9BACL|nr:hypothetical protein [Paenibacillus woosongensis]WHX51118.1 hypothetical protein QNH46_10970 [Paenibacillus woosongensis]